jgi:hypothetical protein
MRKAKIILAAVALSTIAFAIVVPALRRSSRNMLVDLLVNQPLERVRSGHNYAIIADTNLLTKLANDPVCIENLTDMTFSSVTLEAAHRQDLAKMVNLKAVGFYCCRNIDAIVPSLTELDLDLLWFEIGDLSLQSLTLLGDEKPMREIAFEQNLSEAEVAILKAYPDEIKVTTSFPLDAYDRTELMNAVEERHER